MLTRLFQLATSLIIVSHPAAGVSFQVQSLCSEAFTVESDHNASTNDTVGSITVKAHDESGVPYKGGAEGIASIGDSPSGDKAMEVISSTHMRAYGWCFSINGVEPAAMPDKVSITSNDDVIHWYYGFAEYKDGAWITYCTPTHQARPTYICPVESPAGE